MIKQKIFSVHQDIKIGIISKIFFIFAGFFICLVIVLKSFGYFTPDVKEGFIGFLVTASSSYIVDTSLALIIIFIGLGGISLFFSHQFKKLSEIADEIQEYQENE